MRHHKIGDILPTWINLQGRPVTNRAKPAMVLNAILLAVLLVLAHGLLKWVAQHPNETYVSLLLMYWPIILVSIGLYGVVFFYYAHLLKKMDITQLYPIYTGLSIVFLLLVGSVIFRESISLMQTVGCALIISGIFLVSK
jgi:small multidrug resistance pump